jgi:serine/threonine-protein kinase
MVKIINKCKRKIINQIEHYFMNKILHNNEILRSRYKVIKHIGSDKIKNIYAVQDLHLSENFWTVYEILLNIRHKAGENQKYFFRLNTNLMDLTSLSHENLARIIDFFNEKNNLYVISEYFTGINLEKMLDSPKQNFNEMEIMNIAIQICDLFSYFFSKKVKASYYRILLKNIIITYSGILKMINLGISDFVSVNETDEKNAIGSMDYLPPEQMQTGCILDQRSLIYIISALIYHLITKQNPADFSFNLPSAKTFYPAISSEFLLILNKSLDINPKKRYSNLNEFKKELIRYKRKLLNNRP